jgi:predicted ArsR family transcriptional regulator
MAERPVTHDPIEAVASLAEPTRRTLYELVAASREPIGRDDAVAALGISRELAAFHLDRLADVGLLKTEYHRRSGRTGPGAGRPAKFYRRAEGEVTVSLPRRQYDRAAELMATALRGFADNSGMVALAQVARERGASAGIEARRQARRGKARRASFRDLVGVLGDAGYEPDVATDGTMCLWNCPYESLVAEHRDVTCGMNLAWAEGVVEGLGVRNVTVELAPEPGRCCVVLHSGTGPHTA